VRDPSGRLRIAGPALARAVASVQLDVGPWPDLSTPDAAHVGDWITWLRKAFAVNEIAETIAIASPVLAAQISAVCVSPEPDVRQTHRVALAVALYLRRIASRPAPFGTAAGVAPAAFGERLRMRWGTEHVAVARAAGGWLAAVITRIESCDQLLTRLPVVTSDLLTARGGKLVVPHQQTGHDPGSTAAADVEIRLTDEIAAAAEAAKAPIRLSDLAAYVLEQFPEHGVHPHRVAALLAGLVRRGVLLTNLRAPSTHPDALAHLVAVLHDADAHTIPAVSELVDELDAIHHLLQAASAAGPRRDAAARMYKVHSGDGGRPPIAVDLRLDAELTLPWQVAREVERAALILARLCAFPTGRPAWREFHQAFYERYGLGALVPIRDVVDAVGVGWPAGYPGMPAEKPSLPSAREGVLLTLAQRAALDGSHEIVLDDALVDRLDIGPARHRLPPHLELCVQVHAASEQALYRGAFTIEVVSVSRGAGVLSGRFLPVLPEPDRAAYAQAAAALPANDPDTLTVQLSFPPVAATAAHLTRTVPILPIQLSVGEHHRSTSVLTLDDITVGCDGRRLFLAAPALGRRVEVVAMHALNLHRHTPPMARLLLEAGRALNSQIAMFDWGPAASLPFLPRVRYGRVILAPATWRLATSALPPRTAPWAQWNTAFTAWQARRMVPRHIYIVEGDQRLPLDLENHTDRVLLRAQLGRHEELVLAEAPSPQELGWCDRRPHEVVVALTATTPPAWPQLPQPHPARVVDRSRGDAPGTSKVLLAKLYSPVERQDELLAMHLLELLEQMAGPKWWLMRYRDPRPHLRLRFTLDRPADFAAAAAAVSTWATGLQRLGLIDDLVYATSYPETGRWGSGTALAAAEAVFAADSQVVLTQLRLSDRPHRQVLLAANIVAIATDFWGDAATGMQWLTDVIPAQAGPRLPREVFSAGVRLADPSDRFANLRNTATGEQITTAWHPRSVALADYQALPPGPDTAGILPDEVLRSVLHGHYVRAYGIDFDDEDACLHLARSAALVSLRRKERT